MSIVHCVVGLSVTASTFLIAIAKFGSPGSGQKNGADLGRTLDKLLKNNQRLMRKNQHLMGEIASFRSNPVSSQIPGEQVQALDYLAEKNKQLREKNKQLVAESVAIRDRLVGGSETHTEVKAGVIKKIIAWLFSLVRRG
jgi:hypothetical protein